jgi:hypothetical protein
VRSDGLQVLNSVGWVAMATDFSIILYSRLHLIVYNRTLLRVLIAIILINGSLFPTPVIVAGFFDGKIGSKLYKYTSMLEIYFCVQELSVNPLYLPLLEALLGLIFGTPDSNNILLAYLRPTGHSRHRCCTYNTALHRLLRTTVNDPHLYLHHQSENRILSTQSSYRL